MLKKFYEFHFNKQKFYKKNSVIHTILSLAFIVFWVFAFKSSILDANNIPSGSMQPTLKIGDFLFVNKMRYNFHIPFTDLVLFQIDKPQRGDIITFTPPPQEDLRGKTPVKRVVGLPGDTIEVRNNKIFINGHPYPVQPVTKEEDASTLDDLDCQDGGDIRNCYAQNERRKTELYKEKIIDPKTKKLIVEHYILNERRGSPEFTETRSRQSCKPSHVERGLCTDWQGGPLPENKYLVMGDNRDYSLDSRVWGLVDLNQIHGKVFMSYFSVYWGQAKNGLRDDGTNPIILLLQWITFRRPGVFVRWGRVGNRIF